MFTCLIFTRLHHSAFESRLTRRPPREGFRSSAAKAGHSDAHPRDPRPFSLNHMGGNTYKLPLTTTENSRRGSAF